jgi:hypothetical protein
MSVSTAKGDKIRVSYEHITLAMGEVVDGHGLLIDFSGMQNSAVAQSQCETAHIRSGTRTQASRLFMPWGRCPCPRICIARGGLRDFLSRLLGLEGRGARAAQTVLEDLLDLLPRLGLRGPDRLCRPCLPSRRVVPPGQPVPQNIPRATERQQSQ